MTMRGIYVIRFLLFSGAVAIATAVVQRGLTGSERPLLGLGVGFLAGLFVFRGQLRAARGPKLFLSQTALYLVQRKRAVVLPWTAIEGAPVQDGRVTVRLREPMLGPDKLPTQAIKLNAHKLGAGTDDLSKALDGFAREAQSREKLPPDAAIQALFAAR
jgi:hypothetical protein